MEEYAFVLDYLPQGQVKSKYDKVEPIVYAVGEDEFKLFELVAKPGAVVNFGDRVYIGKDSSKRVAIDHVKKRTVYDAISPTAQSELEYAIESIVKANEQKFVEFYNKSGNITLKKHALEELPGLGKTGRDEILAERRKALFKDFADLAERVPTVKAPEKLIMARVVLEIKDPERRRYLFVKDRTPASERR